MSGQNQSGKVPKETVEFGRETHFQAKLDELQEIVIELPSKAQGAAYLDSFTSYLGSFNPFARAIDPDDTVVWLFDNTAYLPQGSSGSDQAGWKAEFIAAFFVKNSNTDVSDLVARISRTIGVARGDRAEKTIEKRLTPLVNTILPARTAHIAIDGWGRAGEQDEEARQLGPSGPSGISHNMIPLPRGPYRDGDKVKSSVVDVRNSLPSQTMFVGGDGWGIISDIDDTIKRTLTDDPVGILRTTFVDDPVPITGMPEFYKHMTEKLNNPPFWYLSASPYNLYPFLRRFREQYYPPGTMLLKDASWMNMAGFIASMAMSTKEYKVGHMKKIQPNIPGRKMICLGDSTQSDPEAYAAVYKDYPGWIKAIFIRRVKNVTEIGDWRPGQGEKERNSDERFERAFEGVPTDIWYVFDEPQELYDKLEEAMARN